MPNTMFAAAPNLTLGHAQTSMIPEPQSIRRSRPIALFCWSSHPRDKPGHADGRCISWLSTTVHLRICPRFAQPHMDWFQRSSACMPLATREFPNSRCRSVLFWAATLAVYLQGAQSPITWRRGPKRFVAITVAVGIGCLSLSLPLSLV